MMFLVSTMIRVVLSHKDSQTVRKIENQTKKWFICRNHLFQSQTSRKRSQWPASHRVNLLFGAFLCRSLPPREATSLKFLRAQASAVLGRQETKPFPPSDKRAPVKRKHVVKNPFNRNPDKLLYKTSQKP